MRHRAFALSTLAGTATVVLVATLSAAQIPDSMDSSAVPNYRVVRPGLALGGQPAPAALAKLKELGFKTVVNLRTEREGAREEEKAVREQGLEYVWVPLTPATFSPADVEAVARVLDDPKAAPVLFHCSSGNRTGGVWAALQARGGKPVEQAEAEGRAAGLESEAMVEAFRRVVAETRAAEKPPR